MLAVFLVSFAGEILEATVTDDASVIGYWLKHNIVESSTRKRHNIVGLNCKWGLHPTITSSSKSHKISTIQFCVGPKCLVLHLSRMKCNVVPPILKNFINDPTNIFVGIEADEVVSVLNKEYGLCCNNTVFDVRALAKRRFPFSFSRRIGVKTLACQLVNLRAWRPRKAFVSDGTFESVKLDEEQVKNACIDVYVLYRIGFKLLMEI